MNTANSNPSNPEGGPAGDAPGNAAHGQAGGGAGPVPPPGEHPHHANPYMGAHAGQPHASYGPAAYAPPPPYQQTPYQQPSYQPPPAYGYYAPYGVPPAQASAATSGQAGLEAAFNDMADKNGLGMLKGLFSWDDGEFWKGALVGAAVVMLMTNEDMRNALINGAASTAKAVKSGFGGGETEEGAEEEQSSDNSNEETET